MIFVTLVRTILVYLMDALLMVMMGRAILSWVDPEEEWKISYFAYCITEPLIQPVRKLCEKNHWFEMSPLDIPFFLTSLILILIQSLVSFL